jgi:hypothetical protein
MYAWNAREIVAKEGFYTLLRLCMRAVFMKELMQLLI